MDGRLAWIHKAAGELGVLDLFPEAAVMQVEVVEERLRRQYISKRRYRVDRDRGTPRGATPPTPPGIRVTYPAVRLG
jgi:hypothetical protein